MSGKDVRATPGDVQRRWEARLWLTDAIKRAASEGIAAGPAVALLEALENLDAIEVVEDLDSERERVVWSSRVGPAETAIAPGQVMRLVGKTDRMLTMPEISDVIVSGKAGGRTRTPAEETRIAFACASITRLKELGMAHGSAVAFVEEDFGPCESDLKKIGAGSASHSLISEYNDALAVLASMDKDEVIFRVVIMSDN